MHGFRACTVVKMMLGRSLEGRKSLKKKLCIKCICGWWKRRVTDGNIAAVTFIFVSLCSNKQQKSVGPRQNKPPFGVFKKYTVYLNNYLFHWMLWGNKQYHVRIICSVINLIIK